MVVCSKKEPRIGDEQGSFPLFPSPSRVSPNNEKRSFLPRPRRWTGRKKPTDKVQQFSWFFLFSKKMYEYLFVSESRRRRYPAANKTFNSFFVPVFRVRLGQTKRSPNGPRTNVPERFLMVLWAEINFVFFVCCLIRVTVVRAVESVSIRRIFQPALWFIYASRTEKFGRGSWS